MRESDGSEVAVAPPSMEPMTLPCPLVDPAWLAEHLADPDLRVIDATVQVKLRPFPRMRSGRREWKCAHIPGATFADLRGLSDPHRPARTFTLPDAEWFASGVGRLGIGDGVRVVVYDRRENMWAARLWWMLRAFGHDHAAVLDGGWQAWQQQGGPSCSRPCAYPPAVFTARPRHGFFVGKEEVLAAIDDPETCIVCALGRRQYRGERREYGWRRGHIPGARNVSAWQVLDRETERYRPVAELRELFGPILDARRVITYCGGGIAASSVAFALHLAGHSDVAVYDGGFMEWSRDRRLPLELGDGTVRDDATSPVLSRT